MTNLDFSVLLPYATLLFPALWITIKIGLVGFLAACLLATLVGGLRTMALPKVIRWILNIYVEFFRGTPLLVQLFIVYYGLPSFGIRMDPVLASILTMGLNSGAYLSENVRGAVLAINKGQYESAAILGYNPVQIAFHIVLPQAFRIAIPSFMNGFSSMIKETSLVSVLPIVELTKLGNQIYAKTYHPFEIYISLALLYFIITYCVTIFAKKLERKLSIWIN
ncbi:MAG: amino acid ABC transporter permease [Lachnospiraceae bacterium]